MSFQEEHNGPFTYYEGARLGQTLGEMSTEQAARHAHEVKALLQKAAPVAISGVSVTVTREGKLEIAHSGGHILIAPQDLELLQEQCTQAMRARDTYNPTLLTDGVTTPAPTDASVPAAARTANYVPGVGATTQIGKYANLQGLFKAIEQSHKARVQAAQQAANASHNRFNW